MPAVFKTLGPFELTRDGNTLRKQSLYDIWWAKRQVDGKKVCRYAIGVYILAVRSGGKFLPLYVGKSDRGFAGRLNNHSIFAKIPETFEGKSLFLFLLARVTTKHQRVIVAKRKASDGSALKAKRLRSINELEFALIKSCLTQNPDLLNKQEKSFHNGVVVPGYWNDSEIDIDPSAKALRKMLT